MRSNVLRETRVMARPKSRKVLDALRDDFLATVDGVDERAVQSFLHRNDHIL